MSSNKHKKEMVKRLLELPTEFETERLIIRKFRKDDGEGLFKLLERNNNREFLKEHVDEATNVQTLSEADTRVRSLAEDFRLRNRFVMGIWLKETDLFIGNIWIEPKMWNVPSYEIGYYLDYGYTKKGYASEAIKRAIKYIFEELKAHKIILITRDTNVDSIKLAERMNFVREGHFRESNIENSKRFGLYYYGMLKHEYENLKK